MSKNLRRGIVFITPNNEYYRNKNLGFGWAILQESETEITWGEATKIEFKNWEDLNHDERAEVLEAFQNTEDRNESDKVAPREEDVKDYYEDNAEKFGFEKIINWETWEKMNSSGIINSISIAIGELERRGVTESERDGLITIDVLIEKLCLKRTVKQKG